MLQIIATRGFQILESRASEWEFSFQRNIFLEFPDKFLATLSRSAHVGLWHRKPWIRAQSVCKLNHVLDANAKLSYDSTVASSQWLVKPKVTNPSSQVSSCHCKLRKPRCKCIYIDAAYETKTGASSKRILTFQKNHWYSLSNFLRFKVVQECFNMSY